MLLRSIVRLSFFAFMLIGLSAVTAEEPFVIHEWGTFTVLQDEQGRALSGVNINEESLPSFTYRLDHRLVKEGPSQPPLHRRTSKGLNSSLSAAKMRMETPIIYLYPPNDEPQTIDIKVGFQGGWISEWFPNADVNAPGFNKNQPNVSSLTDETLGSISWNNLTINSQKSINETDQHVWLAPREVQTPILHNNQGEAEKYLFYRGVANIESPLRVEHDTQSQSYKVLRNPSQNNWKQSFEYQSMWLVDIPKPGQVAYRKVDLSNQKTSNSIVAEVQAGFSETEYCAKNLESLKLDMRHSLIAAGLYEDEAKAMLKTWELSYFKSLGTRIFFTLPRAWTEHVLPMEVSREADIERVMVGRIELVTDRHRQLLNQITRADASEPGWFASHLESLSPDKKQSVLTNLANGSREISDYEFNVPDDYAAYLKLGRFRECILGHAALNSGRLRAFAYDYQIPLP